MSHPSRPTTHRSPVPRRGIPPMPHDLNPPSFPDPNDRVRTSSLWASTEDYLAVESMNRSSSDLGDVEEGMEEGEGEGEDDGEGEGGGEEEEGEDGDEEGEEDSLSDTSSAEYDPDADPETFAKRLDELAGVREVGVIEERASKGGPVLGLLPGDKGQRATSTPLPFDQFRRYILHHLDSTDWQYPETFDLAVRHEAQVDGKMRSKAVPHPIRVLGRQGASINIAHPTPRVEPAADDAESESDDEVQDLGRLRQEVLGGLGLEGY